LVGEGNLRFDNVVKSFGGTRALKGVSFEVARGDVVALLGENGAGKSTLIKVLGGIVRADEGTVSIDGVIYRHRVQTATAPHRVAFIHQDLGLIEWMTVAENMSLAEGFAARPRLLGAIDWRGTEKRAADALALIGGDIDPTARVQSLSRTEKSLVAIARALVVNCDFLVLDEPTASLPANEVERLFAAIRRLKSRGVGMIYVSHRLDEIFRIADHVVVMRDGAKVGETPVAETTPSALVALIVGRSNLDMFAKAPLRPGPVRLSVQG
jgi:ribose transport system ATP-binding protein